MERVRANANRSSRRSRKPLSNNRYSARYLVLVYSQTSERFDPLEIERLVSQEEGQCAIIRRSQNDGSSSYLSFVHFSGKRFQTRNLGLFDIQGHHPRWVHVRSAPWRTFDTMAASGEVVWNGLSRDKETQGQNRESWSPSSSSISATWEYLGSSTNETDILDLCQKYIGAQDSKASISTEVLQPTDLLETNDASHKTDSWRDGYRAGYRDALLYSHGPLDVHRLSHSDSEGLNLLPNVNHSPRQTEQFTGGAMGSDPIDQMLFMNSWSSSDLKPLDWGAEFLPIVLPPS